MFGLPTFRYALAHHKPESVTAFPPGKKDSNHIIYNIILYYIHSGVQMSETTFSFK